MERQRGGAQRRLLAAWLLLRSDNHAHVARGVDVTTWALCCTEALKAAGHDQNLAGHPAGVVRGLASCLLGEAREHLVNCFGVHFAVRHCKPVAGINIAQEVSHGSAPCGAPVRLRQTFQSVPATRQLLVGQALRLAAVARKIPGSRQKPD